jgi:hypothetical protein
MCDHVLAEEVIMVEKESPFACDMTAIAPEQRGAHLATIGNLFRSVEQVSELSNGYNFRLPNNSETLRRAAEFIALERLCCPFFAFALEVEREAGAVYLSLTGREGVKPFIMSEISEHLPVTIQPRK